MKTTVVIPNYNGIKYIGDCLKSLDRERRNPDSFHVLVVDNGSSDGSLKLVQKDFPWVEVIALPENTGFCHAVNVGIEASKTEFVLLLNNDTVVLEDFVVNLEKAIEEDDNIFSVNPMMLSMQDQSIMDDGGDEYNVFGWAYARGKDKPCADYGKRVEVFSACGGASIYRRNRILELGMFDELHFAYLEDVDLGYRARIHGYKNYYEPSAKVIHAGSASSGSRHNAFKAKLASANTAYVIGKNMPLLQIVWNLPFLILGFLVKTAFYTLKGMGLLYAKGYFVGIGRLFTPEGRAKKVKYNFENTKNYLKIQILLYKNAIKMIF